ncbi:hypothetical protein C8R44DRAFT_752927 [Mycena epipterygia]|nr:hypothetical protein C8R44DRAFT_752927 [Mycena epipterygia]
MQFKVVAFISVLFTVAAAQADCVNVALTFTDGIICPINFKVCGPSIVDQTKCCPRAAVLCSQAAGVVRSQAAIPKESISNCQGEGDGREDIQDGVARLEDKQVDEKVDADDVVLRASTSGLVRKSADQPSTPTSAL